MKQTVKIYGEWIKPVMDLLTALVLSVLFFPVLLTVALMNWCMGLPVFFIHQRPGYHAELFGVIKFCTMHPESGRINRWSQLLRKSSVDELPQLLNVLKGEMSLVGPRPLLVEYLADYTMSERKRHDVKPGITGLAQVNGRKAISLKEKLSYDLTYVENFGWRQDVSILMRTFVQVFKLSQADEK